jgi:ATP-dependent DNA helicase RecQ
LDWLNPASSGVESASALIRKIPAARVDPGLAAALKNWRMEEAKRQSVPAYVILHDSTIEELCRRMPRSTADLLEVPGIGERKAQRFGPKILELIGGNDT